jgi:hypothetical protein
LCSLCGHNLPHVEQEPVTWSGDNRLIYIDKSNMMKPLILFVKKMLASQICKYCNKFRNDAEAWVQMGVDISNHFEELFSNSISESPVEEW